MADNRSTKIVKAAYSSANIQCAISGAGPLSGVKAAPFGILAWSSIEYSVKLERSKWWGSAQNPDLRSEARADYEASIEIPVYWWRFIINRAHGLQIALADLEMTLTISYRKRPLTLGDVDTITGCAIKEMNVSHKDGTDNSMATMPLDPMCVFWNGKDVFKNPLSSAA